MRYVLTLTTEMRKGWRMTTSNIRVGQYNDQRYDLGDILFRFVCVFWGIGFKN